jgi:hypothetical protein
MTMMSSKYTAQLSIHDLDGKAQSSGLELPKPVLLDQHLDLDAWYSSGRILVRLPRLLPFEQDRIFGGDSASIKLHHVHEKQASATAGKAS